jgi:plastocyanin
MNKNIYVGLVIVLILIVIGYVWHHDGNGFADSNATSTSQTRTSTDTTASSTSSSTPHLPAAKTTGSGAVQGGSSKSSVTIVVYSDAGFSPFIAEVAQGATVRFVNMSSKGMRIASNQDATHPAYPGFDQEKTVAKGGVFNFIFTKSGTWGYHNQDNIADKGAVAVQPQR